MKSFALIAVAATLLQSTSALPSANGVSIVGDAQHVEERNVHELEKRQTTSSARSRILWKDRLVLSLSLLCSRILISGFTQSRCRFIFLCCRCFIEVVSLPQRFIVFASFLIRIHSHYARMWSRVVTTTTAPRTTTTTSRATTTTTTPRPTSTSTTTSAPASSPTSVAGADVRDLALSEHNRYRAIHNAAPLTWSQPLAE